MKTDIYDTCIRALDDMDELYSMDDVEDVVEGMLYDQGIDAGYEAIMPVLMRAYQDVGRWD